MRELVVRGCDVNAVKANGCAPLHDAATSGRTQAVRELLKLGAAKSVVGALHFIKQLMVVMWRSHVGGRMWHSTSSSSMVVMCRLL